MIRPRKLKLWLLCTTAIHRFAVIMPTAQFSYPANEA